MTTDIVVLFEMPMIAWATLSRWLIVRTSVTLLIGRLIRSSIVVSTMTFVSGIFVALTVVMAVTLIIASSRLSARLTLQSRVTKI